MTDKPKRPRNFGVGDRAAVVRCKHCNELVAHQFKAAHAFECRSKRNRAKLGNMNLEKNGQAMYAVIASRRRLGQWSAPIIEHVHADSPQHAKAQFMAGENPAKTHVIETGLAIGWFEDARGLITG